MAKAFSTKNYFKKIYSPEVLTEFYKRHNITAIFEVTEQTPRKNVIAAITDFYYSLSPEDKIDVEQELALVGSISTKYAPPLFTSLLKKKGLPEVTQIECISDHDKVLYQYLFNPEIFNEVLFFHDFYSSRSYMLYEAKETDLTKVEVSMTELSREFTRIANKDDNKTECDVVYNTLDDIFYVTATFEGAPIVEAKKDAETGELNNTRTTKKKEIVKIAYLPKDKEVLISYTGSKYEKLIFLDTFLRVACECGYEGKVESFNLTPFSDMDFDFAKSNKGVPLMTWKIKAATLSFGNSEKAKKKMKLTIPSSVQEYGLLPLRNTFDEMGILSDSKRYAFENALLSFSFVNTQKPDKSILVNCTVSKTKSSLCPLFPNDRFARTLLKLSGVEQGFVEPVKKEKDEMAKKWEI